MSLTKYQKEAVESTSPATLVIAGPGTGKTHILASRIQYLIEKRGVKPENILCLTFTDSAASAMRERVILFLGEKGYKVDINTFHGFASRLIDENPEIFGYKRSLKALTDITRAQLIKLVIDNLYEEGALKELTTRNDKYFYYPDISSALSTLKREGYSELDYQKMIADWRIEFDAIAQEEKLSTDARRRGKLKIEYERIEKQIEKNKELALIYNAYQQALEEQSLYDYEDMIRVAAAGIAASAILRQDLHAQHKAILVDEYQDTNGAQNKLLFLIINKNKSNIFVVGDDDQAIYRFQGAMIQNFAEFIKRLPKTHIVTLKDNFRSPQLVLDSALMLAANNENRLTRRLKLPDKILIARSESAHIKTFGINEFPTDLEEHAWLIEQIKKLHKEGASWQDTAILVRTNREQNTLSELLRSNDIPYTLSAMGNALEEPRVSSLLSLVRAAANPLNNNDVLAFLLHPATPIKTEDVWHILSLRKKNESIYTALARTVRQKNSELTDHKSAKKTFYILTDLSSDQQVKSGAAWLQEVIERSGYLQWVAAQSDAPYVIANLRALTDEAKRVQEGQEHITINDILAHFQSYYDLNMQLKPNLAYFASSDAVRIMTAHSAKGQEYENIFIVHAVEGNWSGRRNINKLPLHPDIAAQKENEEDARRLFYVALTRTKKNLFVSYAKTYTRGISGLEEKARDTTPSLFVTELSSMIGAQKKSAETDGLLACGIKSPRERKGETSEVIKNIVSDPSFTLNATSLNAFLECPQKFLYEKVLRVPTVKTFSLTYGEAIHLALQKYFEQDKTKRGIDAMMQTIQIYLDTSSTLNEAENRRVFESAQKTLANYLPKLESEENPIEVEYRFPKDEYTFDDVRLSGKIDKISPLNKAGITPKGVSDTPFGVRVVDYKTSKAKTVNAIMGKTQDKYAPGLLRQLLFYKLLLAVDKNFKYTPEQFSLAFVDANREVVVPITQKDYQDFQQQIKKVWNQIQTLKFLSSTKEFPHCGECMYCKLQ